MAKLFDKQMQKQRGDEPASLTNKQKKMLKKTLTKSLKNSLKPVVEKYGKKNGDKVVSDSETESEQDYEHDHEHHGENYGVAEEDVESMDEQDHEHGEHIYFSSDSGSESVGESASEVYSDDSEIYHQVAEDGVEMDEMDNQEFEEKMDELVRWVLKTNSLKFDIEQQLIELGTNQHEDEVALVTEYENSRSDLFDARAQVIASMPGFWPTAIANHPVFGSLIYNPPSGSQLDAEILDYLENVSVDRHPEDFRDITVSFTFVENPFFENEVLRKSFRFDEETEQFEVYQTSKINWVGGLQYLEEGIEDMQEEAESGKRGGDRRLRKLAKKIKKGLRRERHLASSQAQSIFTWFEDEKEVSVGILIAEDLFGRATHWFLGLDDVESESGSESGSGSESESDMQINESDDSEEVGSEEMDSESDEEIDSDEVGSLSEESE